MKIISNFFSSILICVVFGFLYIPFILLIPWPATIWGMILFQAVIPLIAAFIACFVVNHKTFHFKNPDMKRSARRLFVRVFVIICILIAGYFLSAMHPNTYGEIRGMIISILFNYFFYFITAAFLAVFSISEYFFVDVK